MPRRVAETWASILHGVAHLQATRPFSILLAALGLVTLGLWSGWKLTLEPGFEPLLEQDSQTLRDLHRVAEKTSGVSTLFIVLEVPADGPPAESELRAAGDALTGELR